VAAGGSGSGYTYRLSVDGANVYTGSNGTFSWNTANVANGTRTLTATVSDSANAGGSATRSVTVSNAATTPTPTPTPAPTPAPGGLGLFITQPKGGSTMTGTNWVVLWAERTTGSNVYTLSVGGQTVGTTTTTSRGPVSIPWNSASVADGTQVLTASVRDAAGKTGTASVTLTLRNGTTAAPLSAGFTSPAAGATVSGSVNVGLTASGGSGSGYSYRLSLDGATVAITPSYTWNTASATDGSHTLTVTVSDSAGRTASSSRTVTVANAVAAPPPPPAPTPAPPPAPTPAPPPAPTPTPPPAPTPTPPSGSVKVFITQPASGASVGGTAWVVLWAEGTTGSSNAFTLSVDGTTVGSQTTSARGPVTIPWTTASSGNGGHTVTATVRDASGNTGSTSLTVTVRN
jgi:hypothetical protein